MIKTLGLPDVLLIESRVFADERGWFRELWNAARAAGLPAFVQDNIAFSRRRVLRGLHFQQPHAQGKLVTLVSGEVYDVAVDIRPGSASFGRHTAVTLSAESGAAIYIPPGFAHGYQVISDSAHVAYKVTDYYHPESQHTIAWNDPELAIDWPLGDPILSANDRAAPKLSELRAMLHA